MKIGFCMNKYIQINRYLSKYICVCIDKDRILYESYPNILPKKANNYSIGDPASLYKSLLMFYQASNLPHFASPTEVSSGIDRRLEMSGEPPPPNSLLPPRKCPVGSTKDQEFQEKCSLIQLPKESLLSCLYNLAIMLKMIVFLKKSRGR